MIDDKADILTCLGYLKAAYEQTYVTAEQIEVYAAMLADLPLDRLKDTIYQWIATESKWPSVADLRRSCIKAKLNAPMPQMALRQARSGNIQHDLVQHAMDTLEYKPTMLMVSEKLCGIFIATYKELVEEEIKAINDFSMDEHRRRAQERRASTIPGGLGGSGESYGLPASLLSGGGDRVRPAPGDDGEGAVPGRKGPNWVADAQRVVDAVGRGDRGQRARA